jgi:hypothetical protein
MVDLYLHAFYTTLFSHRPTPKFPSTFQQTQHGYIDPGWEVIFVFKGRSDGLMAGADRNLTSCFLDISLWISSVLQITRRQLKM